MEKKSLAEISFQSVIHVTAEANTLGFASLLLYRPMLHIKRQTRSIQSTMHQLNKYTNGLWVENTSSRSVLGSYPLTTEQQ